MGSFAYYTGKEKISEDKRKLFTEQICRILNLGGMMYTDKVSMFGCTIDLLCPVQEDGDKFSFYYNYFEDSPWESAVYDAADGKLYSGKIGDAEFSDTIITAYMLYEIYDPGYGFAEKDGRFVEASETVGWLNWVLGADYTLGKRKNIWECMEYSIDPARSGMHEMDALEMLIPVEWRRMAGGTDLADLLYIGNGTGHLSEENTKEGTYPADILKCRQSLEQFFQAAPKNGLEQLWSLLKKSYSERSQEETDILKPIAQLTLCMPARVFIYLAAELQKLDFWDFWRSLRKEVYHDEQMKVHASAELSESRRKKWEEPVKPVRTSDYLRQDDFFAFYDTPKELKGKPDFYLSDADRLYWWDGSDEVMITPETDEWLKQLAAEHREIMETSEMSQDSISALQKFMELLDEINKYYWRIYPFRSMFYDFAVNISRKEYAAAIELMKRISDSRENRKAGEIINKRRNSGFISKNVTGNEGRIRVKRLYAALANRKLRKKYFAF